MWKTISGTQHPTAAWSYSYGFYALQLRILCQMLPIQRRFEGKLEFVFIFVRPELYCKFYYFKKFSFNVVILTFLFLSQVHTRQHTGERPYACLECRRQFTNWANYNKHMKRIHNCDTSSRKRNTQHPSANNFQPDLFNIKTNKSGDLTVENKTNRRNTSQVVLVAIT